MLDKMVFDPSLQKIEKMDALGPPFVKRYSLFWAKPQSTLGSQTQNGPATVNWGGNTDSHIMAPKYTQT